jgi:opacity protein-like surface antigen
MKKLLVSIAVAAALAATGAHADVVNGNFETNGGAGQVGFNTTLSNWTLGNPAPNTSYFFVFTPGGSPTATGYQGPISLYPTITASPNGGFFIGADPGYQNTTLNQTVGGLVVGNDYNVSFYYAGAQQTGYDGATQEGWSVTFGGQTLDTALLDNANHGFTGWNKATLTFKATSTTQTLSFLATGTQNAGAPPFALLDGVSVTPVPEPATWAMMIMGFGLMGMMMRRRRLATLTA